LGSDGHDVDIALFRGEVEVLTGGHGRGSEGFAPRAEAFAEVNLAGGGFNAGEDAVPIAAKQKGAQYEWSLHVAAQARKAPDDRVVGGLD